MAKFALFAAVATLASFSLVPYSAYSDALIPGVVQSAGVPLKISEGKMIYGRDGRRLAPVYRVNSDRSVQLIMDGRLVTIPATILSDIDGKLISSQNKGDLLR